MFVGGEDLEILEGYGFIFQNFTSNFQVLFLMPEMSEPNIFLLVISGVMKRKVNESLYMKKC